MKKEEVTAVFIRLDAGRENTILSILLAADGTVNRMGNGRAGDIDAEKVLNIGAGQQRLFHDFISRIPDNLLERGGRYNMPEPQGTPCQLTLLFAGRGTTGTSFEVHYGSESEGPPLDIRELVVAAVEITDGWLRAQEPNANKPWWKPW